MVSVDRIWMSSERVTSPGTRLRNLGFTKSHGARGEPRASFAGHRAFRRDVKR
jgi:hypothetical protein